MEEQSGQSMKHLGWFYEILILPKKNFDLELRERTRDTNFTLEDTQEMLETAWLAAAILTMV